MNTLSPIFDWLLAVSFRASLLTMVVLLLQLVLRHHLTARMRYALWLPVLIVLLMPVFPQSRWSVENVFAAPPPVLQMTPATIDHDPVSLPLDLSPKPAVPTTIDWPCILFITWLIGASGILLFGSASFFITLRRFKRSRHPVSEELSATLAQIACEVRLRRVPRVWIAYSISSPAVTGLLRPTLLLPAVFDHAFTPVEARLVLKHELMHLKRHDLPLNALLCVLMALHWFNPLLWLAFFKVRLDREAACDAQVLQNDSADHRREYGHALLKVETAFCPRGLSLGFVGIFQRGSALRSRINSIVSQHQPHPIMKAILVTCMLLMTLLGVTRAQQPAAKDAESILIEVKVIDITTPAADTVTFKAGGLSFSPSASTTDPIVYTSDVMLAAETYAALISEVGRRSDASVLAAPTVTTRIGSRAAISIAREVMLTGEKTPVNIGLECELTPVSHDQTILVQSAVHLTELLDKTTQTISDPTQGIEGKQLTPRRLGKKGDLNIPDGHTAIFGIRRPDGVGQHRQLIVAITPRPVADPASAINSKLRDIILPQVHFSGATIEEVIEYLHVKSREFDTLDKTGVQFILRPGETKPGRISLDLTNVPLIEALRYCTELAGLKYKVEPYAVTIVPANTEMPANLEITANETFYNKKTGILTAKGDVKTHFGQFAIQANELVHDQKNQQLQMIAPFTLLAEGTKQITSTDANAVATLDLKTSRLSIQGGHETRVVDALRADQIIIPSVQFREATLAEAIDFIRIKAAQVNPGKKGVNIIVKPGAPDAKITLDLKEIPVTEALRYISELSGCRLTVEGQTFILAPVDAP